MCERDESVMEWSGDLRTSLGMVLVESRGISKGWSPRMLTYYRPRPGSRMWSRGQGPSDAVVKGSKAFTIGVQYTVNKALMDKLPPCKG